MAGPRISGQHSVLLGSLTTGFKNSLMNFGETLSQDLKDLKLKGGTLLQYRDNLLITGTSFQQCLTNTIATLNHMASCGYKVSAQKAHICQQAIRPLGFLFERGKRSVIESRKETIIHMGAPNTRKQLRGFLRMASYYCIWIPNFGVIAKSLCPEYRPLEWTKESAQAFEPLKEHLASALALILPNLLKPFKLYVHEKQDIALGVPTQTLSDMSQPTAYLPKKLNHTIQGWPACLRAGSATCKLLQEAEVFLGTAHQVLSLLEGKNVAHCWKNG